MNHVTLLGNLTADPERRATSTGKAVVEWTLAVNERWKAATGEEKERCSFIGCYAWGPKGEAFARFHRKGQKALVEGKVVQESWEDKTTGRKQSKTRVQVAEFHFVGGAKGEASQPQPKAAAPQPNVLPTEADAPQPPEDDVPF